MIRHQYSRLCCLIDNSLNPFTVKSTLSITKEQEKSLLISLSQVLNQIKLWIGEFGSDSVSDNCDHGNQLIDISGTSIHGSICHSSPSGCIFKIINNLVFLLAVGSPYARHLAGNVLVAISEFVVSSENYWEEFMKSLCSYVNLIIYKAVSPSSNPPRSKHLDHDSSTLKLDFPFVSSDARWCSVSNIISVLRNILKQLKHEEDDELLEVYFNSLSSCLRDIPWESCNQIPIEFCGHLVQLFCSMVDSDNTNPVIQEILNIFPRFLTWCLGNECGYTSISQYIRYKILVLMIRLSSLVELDCEMVVSWLNLIDKYFQDVLYESLKVDRDLQDDCLKDSPFHEEEKENCHRHIQRRVVFLYVKCGFLLIRLEERPTNKCSSGDCSKKGFTAIHDWLKKHVHSEFAKSILQLYIHEDDMLFEVLLLLTDIPNQITEDPTLQAVFDPVHLLHLFLSEIHYDHQVILDYLISKDTGATCAEYLLRCLRILCDKWNTFLKFPSYKRRKVRDSVISDDARECLLVLKKSVESLYQKDLFPYNPKVLLKRLTRYEELSSMP